MTALVDSLGTTIGKGPCGWAGVVQVELMVGRGPPYEDATTLRGSQASGFGH